MGTGSGLCGQLGFAPESTFGTFVASTKFLEFNQESLKQDKTTRVSEGIRACGRVARAARRVVTRRAAAGDVEVDVASRTFGLIWQNLLGTTTPGPTQIGVTPLWRQIHIPGEFTGRSMSWQLGRPQSDGVVKAYSYPGVKVPDWELSCEVDGNLTLKLSLDSRAEDDAQSLAVASFVTTNVEMFGFEQLAVNVGGTVSTASGLATLAGSSPLAGCTGFTIKGVTPLATDRVFAGSGGLKAAQIENGMRQYTVDLKGEFADKTQIYDRFKSDASTPLEFVFTGAVDVGTSNFAQLRLMLSAMKFDEGVPNVAGPEVLSNDSKLTAYDDGTNAVIQLVYDSVDTTL